MSYNTTITSSIEVLNLTTVKNHLRVEHSDDDTLISGYTESVIDYLESITGRVIGQKVVTQYLNDFPLSDNPIILETNYLSGLTIQYYTDVTSSASTFSSNDYRIITLGSYTQVQPNNNWVTTDDKEGSVVLTYTAGYYTTNDIPKAIKQAALLLIGHYYEHRENVIIGSITSTLDFTIDALITPHKYFSV